MWGLLSIAINGKVTGTLVQKFSTVSYPLGIQISKNITKWKKMKLIIWKTFLKINLFFVNVKNYLNCNRGNTTYLLLKSNLMYL